jgi:cardiolipin synthase (CMP-forming)
MTIPNFITIIRLLLIPVFVMCVLYYVTDREGPEPSELLRWWATAIFITAAISDGVDGYIARRFNQRSELGAVLDPLADKLLQVTALILLSFDFKGAFEPVPLWLPILVVSRDLFILVGFMVLKLVLGVKVEVRAHWSGKVATALTMVVIAMVLLRWTNSPLYDVTLFGAGTCILVSLLVYVFRGIMQVNQTPAPSR